MVNLFKKLLICMLLVPGFLMAQGTDKKESKPLPKKKKWKLNINGGLTLNSGNTSSKLYNGEIGFSVKLDGMVYTTNYETLYGKSHDEVIQNKGKWANDFSKKIKKNLNLFGMLVLEFDKIANIGLRTTTGIGLKYDIIDKDSSKALVTASLNGEFLNPLKNLEKKESIRLNIAFSSKFEFSKTSRFAMQMLYTPSIASLTEDFRMEATASLSLLMKSPIWFTFKIKERFNNLPITADIKKNDLTLINSIEIAI